jgi:hypothetical protein
MKVLMVPLDDRPVTYCLPQSIAKVAGVEALVPPRQLFGTLKQGANVDALFNWIDTTLGSTKVDAIFVCVDTLVYGGLINSRRSSETLPTLLSRVSSMANWKKKAGQTPIFIQSSIMRISDNHDATEEKEYWARYGREIFAWSTNLHRLNAQGSIASGVLRESEMRVPETIRQDYVKTRFRNYQINLALLEQVNKGAFSRVVYSLDDSGEHGLNVLEQEKILTRIKQLNLSERALTYAGADEVLCSMFAFWLSQTSEQRASSPSGPTAMIQYALPATEFCQSRYEGQSIGNSVRAQMKACGLRTVDADAEKQVLASLCVIVHGGENGQGDHILLPGHQDLRSIDTKEAVASTLELIASSELPCILCDVAYANGADPLLVQSLLEKPNLLAKLYAYGGWNTSGNTLGSTLALGIARWFAADSERSARALKDVLYIRLADDWAYQTQVRRNLSAVSVPYLQEQMRPLLDKISTALGYSPERENISFPWDRSFEVEIDTAGSRATAGSASSL